MAMTASQVHTAPLNVHPDSLGERIPQQTSRCYLREAEKDSSRMVESFALRMKLRCRNFGNTQVLDTLSIGQSRNDHTWSYYPRAPVCYT